MKGWIDRGMEAREEERKEGRKERRKGKGRRKGEMEEDRRGRYQYPLANTIP